MLKKNITSNKIVNDNELKNKIDDLINNTMDIKIEDLKINVDHRIVVLDGFIKSKIEKEKLEKLIMTIKGVRSINNRIVIIPQDLEEDKRIALKVIESIKKEPRIELNNIKIMVENKVITLYGTVPSYSAHDAAECAALFSKDAIKVINKLNWILRYYEISK